MISHPTKRLLYFACFDGLNLPLLLSNKALTILFKKTNMIISLIAQSILHVFNLYTFSFTRINYLFYSFIVWYQCAAVSSFSMALIFIDQLLYLLFVQISHCHLCVPSISIIHESPARFPNQAVHRWEACLAGNLILMAGTRCSRRTSLYSFNLRCAT